MAKVKEKRDVYRWCNHCLKDGGDSKLCVACLRLTIARGLRMKKIAAPYGFKEEKEVKSDGRKQVLEEQN